MTAPAPPALTRYERDVVESPLGHETMAMVPCATGAWVRYADVLAALAAPPPDAGLVALDGVARIAAERQRQMSVEGWTPEHDDTHWAGDLAAAAACLAVEQTDGDFTYAYWEGSWIQALQEKHALSDRVRQLEIAGALIAAEIDRLLRLSALPARPTETPT